MIDHRAPLMCFALFACAPEAPPAPVEAPDAAAVVTEVPPAVLAAATAALPGFVLVEATRKERDGRVYFDVEGARADGAEVELDLLETPGGWEVVEIQRDIDWAQAPDAVRTAAADARGAFEPVRVIESTQAADGSVIYELFKPDRPEAPSLEVRFVDGAATVLTTANPH